MKEYKIIEEPFIEDLQLRVNKYLNDGWELAGGICFATVSDIFEGTAFLQALIKTGEKV